MGGSSMRYTVRTLWSQLPCLAAGTLWAVYVALTVLGVNVGADDEGRLFGMATVCLTFWAILCHRDRVRDGGNGLQERVEDQQRRLDAQDQAWAAWRETAEAIDAGRRHLRGIAGGKG